MTTDDNVWILFQYLLSRMLDCYFQVELGLNTNKYKSEDLIVSWILKLLVCILMLTMAKLVVYYIFFFSTVCNHVPFLTRIRLSALNQFVIYMAFATNDVRTYVSHRTEVLYHFAPTVLVAPNDSYMWIVLWQVLCSSCILFMLALHVYLQCFLLCLCCYFYCTWLSILTCEL